MRKIMFLLIFSIISSTFTYSIDEFRIGETIKIYDQNLNELQSRITYYPAPYFHMNKVIFLYFFEYIQYAIVLNDELREEFVEVLTKCIEWTIIARDNNVHRVTQPIKERLGVPFIIPNISRNLDVLFLTFLFSIQEINGREEIMLIINYKTIEQDNYGRQGSYIIIKQNDFERLKEVFSANFLIQFDERAEEQLRIEELFR